MTNDFGHEVHDLQRRGSGWRVVCICGAELPARRTILNAYREMEDHIMGQWNEDE